MLRTEEREEIIRALTEWAAFAPEEPVLGFMQSERLKTPQELLIDVRQNTADGEALMQILEHGVRRIGIESVVQKLTQGRRMNM